MLGWSQPLVYLIESVEVVLFSSPPLDGTVSSHYTAEAEEGLLSIQWQEPFIHMRLPAIQF